jgi:hypothetical protein
MPSAPFVNYHCVPLHELGPTPIELDIAKDHVCILDGLIVANNSEDNLTISVDLIREGVCYEILSRYSLTFEETEDVFSNKTLYLKIGDKISVFCDPNQDRIHMFLSYRELVEL